MKKSPQPTARAAPHGVQRRPGGRPKKPAHEQLSGFVRAVADRFEIAGVDDRDDPPKPGERARFLAIVERERKKQRERAAAAGKVIKRPLSEKAVWDRINRANRERTEAEPPKAPALEAALKRIKRRR